MTIADMLRRHARTRPHKPAIVECAGSIDYATLDRMVDGVCARFARHGIARGDLIGVSLGNDARHVVALIALGRIGAVLLPLDRRWTVGESDSVAGRFGARHILTDRDGAPAWVRTDADWFTPSDTAYDDPALNDDCPMVLSLSSGTTGLPKGPLLTQRQFLSRFMVYWIDIGFGSRDRFLVPTPLYFGGGRAFAGGKTIKAELSKLLPKLQGE